MEKSVCACVCAGKKEKESESVSIGKCENELLLASMNCSILLLNGFETWVKNW